MDAASGSLLRSEVVPGTEVANGGSTWSPCILLAPIPAMTVGIMLAAGLGVPWSAYASSIALMVLGGASVLLLRHAGRDRLEVVARVMPTVALVMIAATLVEHDVDGVHRWIAVGPFQLNASAAFSPWLFVGFASGQHRVRMATAPILVAAQILHVMQPDAAQASAVACGALALLPALPEGKRAFGLVTGVAVVVLCAATWCRRDPLLPVEHVERILFVAAAKGAAWSFAAIAASAIMFVPFLLDIRVRRRGMVPVLFLAAMFAASFLGNFPVPVFGAGAGPVLGWYGLAAVFATYDHAA